MGSHSVSMFQYSFCSYSTQIKLKRSGWKRCFNTASVLIQQSILVMRMQIYSVSIQLLFLFNIVPHFLSSNLYRFNTASVLIQRRWQQRRRNQPNCFNTASVLIQLLRLAMEIAVLKRFNTASVLIQRVLLGFMYSWAACFNTASVLIQHKNKLFKSILYRFQYSFCSYSTSAGALSGVFCSSFQYSFCSYCLLYTSDAADEL